MKSGVEGREAEDIIVAPCAGAWIEILLLLDFSAAVWSPPARGRGLKYAGSNNRAAFWGSPPARGRGLKWVGF